MSKPIRTCPKCRDGLPRGVSYCVACYPEPRRRNDEEPPVPFAQELRDVMGGRRRASPTTAFVGGAFTAMGLFTLMVTEFHERDLPLIGRHSLWLFVIVFVVAPNVLLRHSTLYSLRNPSGQFWSSERHEQFDIYGLVQFLAYVFGLLMTFAIGAALHWAYQRVR